VAVVQRKARNRLSVCVFNLDSQQRFIGSMIDQDDERIREVVSITPRFLLHEAAFHAVHDELPDLANLSLQIAVAILQGVFRDRIRFVVGGVNGHYG